MLTHPQAVQLIKGARQQNVANPWRSTRDFEHILQDFFIDRLDQGCLLDTSVCDLGPGQYDMLRFFREAGAKCSAIDNDEAVIAVGRCLGFEVFELNMKELGVFQLDRQFDGIFCKFAINAFWSDSPEQTESQTCDLCRMLEPAGWGWIAPWNGVPKKSTGRRFEKQMLDAQRSAFESAGWRAHDLSKAEIARYGVNGSVANNILFLRNL